MPKLKYHYLGNPDAISQSFDRTIEASLCATGTKVFVVVVVCFKEQFVVYFYFFNNDFYWNITVL